MRAKPILVLLVFLLIWGAFLTTIRPINMQGSLKHHPFLTFGARTLTTVGLSPAAFANELESASPWLNRVVEFGYHVRFRLLDFSRFLTYSLDPTAPLKLQLVLREEIPAEFEGAKTYEILERVSRSIFDRARRAEARTGAKIAVMIIPTKISANKLDVKLDDSDLWVLRFWEVDSHAKRAPFFAMQERLEADLDKLGQFTLPILQLYRERQNGRDNLYPRGESHWTPELFVSLALPILENLQRASYIPKECIASHAPLQPIRKEERYLGDLVDSLGWKETYSDTALFTDTVGVYAPPTPPEFHENCPDLYDAGTSYGEISVYGARFADALQQHYLGRVINKSVGGQGPLTSLRSLKEKLTRPSVILWEFAFRQMPEIERPE